MIWNAVERAKDTVFLFVPLYLALIVGILILRKREPYAERPYRAWGHPYSTIVCLIGWATVTLVQAYAENETALYAVQWWPCPGLCINISPVSESAEIHKGMIL